jgi:two-component system OmpR family sensor kinase
LLLTVVDSGSGMPEDFLPVAFDRFSRSDRSRASNDVGSGLGLAIVHAIVSAAQGAISLSNAAGFTVTVSLPTAR